MVNDLDEAEGGSQPAESRELVIVDLGHAPMMRRFGVIGSADLGRTGRWHYRGAAMPATSGWDTDKFDASQLAARQAFDGLDRWVKEHPFLFCLLIGLLVVGLAWVFRPVPATTKFGGSWKAYVGSDFQVSLPKRYVGGLGSSGAGAAIAEAAETVPFYEEIAKPELADLSEEAMLWAIAPIDCCQSWAEVAGSFLDGDDDPQSGHSGVTEVLLLKFPAQEDETLALFRESWADPAIKPQDEQNVALAGHQAIRWVEDLEDSRYLTYLVGDDAAFWVIAFSADRDKFSAFMPLFDRSAHSFRLPAAQ